MAGVGCLRHCSLAGPEGSCIMAGSALLGQSQEEMGILERRCLLDCAQCQLFKGGKRELVGFPAPAIGMSRPGSPPRDGVTAKREPWGSNTTVGYESLQTCLLTGGAPGAVDTPTATAMWRSFPQHTGKAPAWRQPQRGAGHCLSSSSQCGSGSACEMGRGSQLPKWVSLLTLGCAPLEGWL